MSERWALVNVKLPTHPFRTAPMDGLNGPVSWVNVWQSILWFDSRQAAEAARRNDERVVDEDEAREIAVVLAMIGKPESHRHET